MDEIIEPPVQPETEAYLYVNKNTGEKRVSENRWNPAGKKWPKMWDEFALIRGAKTCLSQPL